MTQLEHEECSLDLQEFKRLKALTIFEQRAYKKGFRAIAGTDEAGRGPLAGPVVAALCLLPKGYLLSGVDDSKKLSSAKREDLFKKITEDSRVTYAVGVIDAVMIDQINILRASLEAMMLAFMQIVKKPDYILVDGDRVPNFPVSAQAVIHGDALSLSIAIASIIAKVTRDRLMVEYHSRWPSYGFDKHKGYGTVEHLENLKLYGPCPIHRRSFEPLKSALCGLVEI